jgi:hypothetical protein
MGAPGGDCTVAESQPMKRAAGIISEKLNGTTAASSAAWRMLNFFASADCESIGHGAHLRRRDRRLLHFFSLMRRILSEFLGFSAFYPPVCHHAARPDPDLAQKRDLKDTRVRRK